MPFQKGQPRAKGAGRRKGTPNKSTAELKESILIAFHQAGGADYLSGLASTHPHVFCTLLGKIIPAEVKAEITGKDGGPIVTELVIEHHDSEAEEDTSPLDQTVSGNGRVQTGAAIPSGPDAGVEVNGKVPAGAGGHPVGKDELVPVVAPSRNQEPWIR